MMNKKNRDRGPYPSAEKAARHEREKTHEAPEDGSSYRLAFQDPDLLLREELRPVRIQLEIIKPDLLMDDHNIDSTVVFFGSARIPDPETAKKRVDELQAQVDADPPGDNKLRHELALARKNQEKSAYYVEAQKLSRMITVCTEEKCMVPITGGGGGIMEAANRGAYEGGAPSIGLNIVLPHEQKPNSYISPELCFQFHYFATRKMHFLMRAKGLVAFPGGLGTLDEVFETLTLMQTGKIDPFPVIFFGREYWEKVISFQALVEEGTIDEADLNLFQFVERAEEAWEIITAYNGMAAEGS
ncbi:MAG: TIGR00730 family Rossman fold protein [Desulfohalobiaceae bacterium]|nr:TIGR00730 family Rossman fold protein [Desulfohalobiaceae bacterium]